MKKIIIAAFAAVLGLALILGVMTYHTTTNALLSANINALTNNEDSQTGGSNNDGAGTSGSNNEGDGSKFYYTHLLGDPKGCTLYRNIDVNGSVSYTEQQVSGNFTLSSVKVSGLEEFCPDRGGGCTAYSCQKTN